MYMLAHQQPDGSRVLSVDLLRHHDEHGILPQCDILDELLADVEPLPVVEPVTLPPAVSARGLQCHIATMRAHPARHSD